MDGRTCYVSTPRSEAPVVLSPVEVAAEPQTPRHLDNHLCRLTRFRGHQSPGDGYRPPAPGPRSPSSRINSPACSRSLTVGPSRLLSRCCFQSSHLRGSRGACGLARRRPLVGLVVPVRSRRPAATKRRHLFDHLARTDQTGYRRRAEGREIVVVHLIGKPRVATLIRAGICGKSMLALFGKASRRHAIWTRCWPEVNAPLKVPMSLLPCGFNAKNQPHDKHLYAGSFVSG
jgi:hypothetical protein